MRAIDSYTLTCYTFILRCRDHYITFYDMALPCVRVVSRRVYVRERCRLLLVSKGCRILFSQCASGGTLRFSSGSD